MADEVFAVEGSSRRTKNRVNHHNLYVSEFADVDNPAVTIFNHFFRCRDEGCKWMGWLPKDEVIVKPKED